MSFSTQLQIDYCEPVQFGCPMRLTRQTNYAIRLLMFCAANTDRLSRVQEISKANAVSGPFLFKILQPLVEHGLVESVRGRNGGIRLAKPSDQITLTDVIVATENKCEIHDCAAEGIADCPLKEHCTYHSVLKRAFDAFHTVLSQHTIADLVANRGDIKRVFRIIDGDRA